MRKDTDVLEKPIPALMGWIGVRLSRFNEKNPFGVAEVDDGN